MPDGERWAAVDDQPERPPLWSAASSGPDWRPTTRRERDRIHKAWLERCGDDRWT